MCPSQTNKLTLKPSTEYAAPDTLSIAPTLELAEKLLHISNQLLTIYDVDQLLHLIIKFVRELVEYETAAVHLVEDDWLHTRVGIGNAANTIGQTNYRRESDFVWQFVEREGKPYLTNDLQQEAWQPLVGFESIRSFLAVPLQVQNRLIGILTIDHSEPHRFSQQHVDVVVLFASQAALALENRRLFEREQRRIESELHQRQFADSQLTFSYRLMQTTTIDEALNALLSTIAENAPYHAGAVTLVAQSDEQLGHVMATYGYGSPDQAHHRPVEMHRFALLNQMIEERNPVYVPDTRMESRWHAGTTSDPQEVRSVLLIPLIYDPLSELIGYVTLKNYQPSAFSGSTRANVTLLCNQTAATLRTLRLLEEARRRLNEVTVLTAMSAHLNQSFELQETLQFVLDLVIGVIGQGERVQDLRGAIILRQPGSNILRLAAGHNLEVEEIERFNNRPYFIHEGTFARSIGRGEWVEIDDENVVIQSMSTQFSHISPRQLLDIPLNVGSETIGAITVDHIVRDQTTRQLLYAITNLASSAIQKTQALTDSRQRAVELLETYERLQVMDEERDEFIQNITHDLKAPLTFIRGYAELMAEGALGSITAEQSEALEIIQDRADAISQLVADILTLKQMEAHPLQELPFNLAQMAHKSVRNARMAARLADLEINALTNQENVIVKGDAARMEQVFENLLSNSIKYSPNGGEIHVSVQTRLDKAQVSITDQGIGIPEEEIDKIWNRYYRVAGVSAQGTGLGLANVRRIVEAHGGRIWVQSGGKGTNFTFELPLHVEIGI